MVKAKNASVLSMSIVIIGLMLGFGMEVSGGQGALSVTGTVTSEAEGRMEGVLVGAKAVGSTITTYVVSDNEGRYSFPAGRVRPGKYQLSIRAVGYELSDTAPVEVTAAGSTVDLKLQKARDIFSQLSYGEVLLSIPGTPEQKAMLQGCVSCHSLAVVMRAKHDEEQWLRVLERMQWHNNGSSLARPTYNPGTPPMVKDYIKYWEQSGQKLPEGAGGGAESGYEVAAGRTDEARRPLARYLAEITPWNNYPVKTLPRPKGAGTRVIMTMYDLPRPDAEPHDAVVTPDGTVWYGDFSVNLVGSLNPKTGETKEYTIPPLRPFPPFAPGGLGLDVDSDGNVWFALMRQDGMAKLDTKSGKVSTWAVPEPCWSPPTTPGQRVSGQVAAQAGGKLVWLKAECGDGTLRIFGVNQNTMQLEKTHAGGPGNPLGDIDFYGINVTPQGTVIGLNIANSEIVEIDTATSKITRYKTPTPRSGPKRGEVDEKGRLWYAGSRSGHIGMFDPATKQFKEYAVQVPGAEHMTDPYRAIIDKNGDAWAGGEILDYVYRVKTSTGQVTHYMLPLVQFDVRHAWDDSVADRPVSIWLGANHHGKILKLEPLD